jgi:DNA-binding CsgD family transcriptional regulator
MARNDEILRSIECIHDAVLQPDGWGLALASFATAADSEHAHLMLRRNGAPALIEAHRMTVEQMAGLARMERVRDPHWGRVSAIPQGSAVRGSQFISDSEFLRSEFYNEAIRPMGAFHGIVAKPLKAREAEATLSVGRQLGRDDFSEDDVAVVRMVLPHLTSALEAKMKLDEAQSQARMAAYAFEAMNVAVIMVDAKAKVTFANGLAEVYLSRGSSLTADGIHIGGAETPTLRRLHGAIAQCTGAASLRASIAPVVIAAPDGSAALRVTFIPLGRNAIDLHHSYIGLAQPVALLMVNDLAEQRRAMRARLSARFELTTAESGVVMEVIAGGDREEIARRLGVLVSTVRTHLTHIFEKTGVRRQSELVCLALDADLQLRSLDASQREP